MEYLVSLVATWATGESAWFGQADRNKRFGFTYPLRNKLLPKLISGELPVVVPRSELI